MNNSYIIGNILPVSYYTNHWLFTLLIRSCPLFFTDKMNSILIFVGCGVIIVIVLVTCVILTTRCHLRIRPDHQGEAHMSSSNSSKQQLYHPYCIDTMTLVRQILPHMKSITIHVYVHVWSHPPKNSSYKCYGFHALDGKTIYVSEIKQSSIALDCSLNLVVLSMGLTEAFDICRNHVSD